jgi:hypothetical protein
VVQQETNGPDDAFAPLWQRGVSPEVAENRGYVPYYGRKHPLHDPETVRAFLGLYDLSSGQRSTLMRFMNSARDEEPSADRNREGYGHGLIMPKYPFPGEPNIAPQLRPQYAVRTGAMTFHCHNDSFSGDPSELARHLADDHPGEDIAGDVWHWHEDFGKYLITPNAKEDWKHDHAEDPRFQGENGLRLLRRHMKARKWKRDHDNQGILTTRTPGKHKHRKDIPGQNVANRIDIHPSALERLWTAACVYFVLEGTPKNDSVLTRIIATGVAASVCNVPSVTLWRAPELRRFIAMLRALGVRVIIVADADWHDNDRVVRQALLCRDYFRSYGHGLNVCIAAPPADREPPCEEDAKGKLKYKGVDDFLAAGGGLDDLLVVDREASFSLALHTASKDGVDTGQIRGAPVSLSAILGVGRSAERVRDTLLNHIDRGLITSDRPLDLEVDEWTGGLGWKGERADWPTFTIRDDLRYTEESIRLADYDGTAISASFENIFGEEFEAAYICDDLPLPAPVHVAAAIKGTAERLDLKPDTVSKNPYVKGFRTVLIEAREHIALTLPDGNHGIPASTVRDIQNKHQAEEQTSMELMTTVEVSTDERIAAAAQRLSTMATELADVASLLALRFPDDERLPRASEYFVRLVADA